jgi:hypothetical protein
MNQREARKHALRILAATARQCSDSVLGREDLPEPDRTRMSLAFSEEADRLERLVMGARGWKRKADKAYPLHPDQMTIEDVPA